jgi:VCBS repeat-containing protein
VALTDLFQSVVIIIGLWAVAWLVSGMAGGTGKVITAAIENAVTNIAMDITVRASDPRVRIVNHTGTLAGVSAGQTANFDIEFVGDGRPHRFDLQFVRAGTNVVVGSIPVVLGTPVIGEGYQFDDLSDGEIHSSCDFGSYVANVAPTFLGGGDQAMIEDAGPQSLVGWATGISPGPANESAQVVRFLVTIDNPALFSTAPSVSADGTLTFTPAPNAHGTATVTVQARDNGGTGLLGADTSVPHTFLITIAPVNDAPTAADDTFSGLDGALLAIAAPGAIGNDVDVDGDPISARLVDGPLRGTVTFLADGSFDYVPGVGFRGTDNFRYVVSDGVLDSNVATITVSLPHVNAVPVAVDDAYDATEDTDLIVVAAGITGNDSDGDLDPLTAVVVTAPAHGTLALDPSGAFRYTPAANYFGPDAFTYLVTDGFADSNLATVSILVASVDEPPVALGDTFTVDEDAVLDSLLDTVLVNDVNPEGAPLTAVLVAAPAHGVVALAANGTFIYTPDPNYNGPDSFTYSASDGALLSAPATVTIVVTPTNDAPVATGEAYATDEDTPLIVAAPGLLANDVDIDGDRLSVGLVDRPLRGTVVASANGSFSYVPALNFSGTDSFSYRVSDGDGRDSNTVIVTIAVSPVNDAPTATADTYAVSQDRALSVAAPGVLINDRDVDANPLLAVLVTGPVNGQLTLNADGSFTYTPNVGYVGSDSFTYQSSDGLLLSAPVAVTFTVTAPPAKFYVADGTNGTTYKYSTTGSTLGSNVLSGRGALGIASNAAGTTQWVVDSGGNVFVYTNTGTLLGQWTPRGAGRPEGVTVWGNDL